MSAIHFESTYDDRKLEAGLRRSDQRIADWARSAAHSGETVEQTFERIKQSVYAIASIEFARRMVTEVANVRGEWQKYEAVLTNTLGSNKEAVQSLEMISDYGAKTNFQVNELTDSYVKLANQGFKPTRKEIALLGDLAASKAKSFDQLSEAIIDAETMEFERLKEFGIRASKNGEEVTFTFKGIKTTVDASAKSIRNYILSLGELDGVKGSTEAISKTIVGLISNFEDAVDRMFNSLGKESEETIADAIKMGTDLVNNYQDVIDILKVIATAYGTYKAALIATTVVQKSALLAVQIREYYQMGRALGFATANHIAFNSAAVSNPYALVAAGVATLIVALTSFGKESEVAAEAYANFKSELDETTKEIDANFKKLTDTQIGTDKRRKAVESINSEYGQYLTNLLDEKSSLEDIKKAQNEATEALAKNLAFRAQDEAIEETKLKADKAARSFYELINDLSSKLTNEQSGVFKASVDTYLESLKNSFEKTGQFASISAENIRSIFELSGGEMTLFNSGNIQSAQYAAQDLIKTQVELEDSTKDLKEQYESYLNALGLTGTTTDDVEEELLTISEQIENTQKALLEARKLLDEYRSPSSTATEKDIEKQVKAIKELEKSLEMLTGLKKKAADEVKTIKDELDKLYNDLETADERDKKIIAARILVLQQELLLREKIAENAVKALRDEPAPSKIKPIQATVSTKQTGKADSKSLIDWIAVFGDLDRLSTDALKDLRSKLKKYLSQIDDDISKEDFKEITDAFNAIKESIETRTPFDTISDSVADLKYFNAKVELQKKIVDQKKQEGASTEEILRAERDLLAAQNGRAESLTKITKGINQIGRDGAELVSAIREYTVMLGNFGIDIGDQGREIVDGVGQIMNGLESIDLTKPFSIVTGTIKAVSGFGNVIASLLGGGDSKLSQKTFDRYDDLMATMDDLISKQKELLDAMAGAEAVAKSDEAVALINKQIEATRQLGREWLNSGASWKSHSHGNKLRKSLRDFADEFSSIGIDFDSLGGRVEGLLSLSPEQLQTLKEEVPEAWARIDDQTRSYLQTIIDSGDELEGMKDQLNEALTGLSFDSAKNSLKDFLMDTDATMADIADNFEDYMKGAIIGVIVDSTMKDRIKAWWDQFASKMSDGELSGNEKDYLKNMWDGIAQDSINMRDAAFDAAGLDIESASSTGLSGQIGRSITEDTGSELVGLWNRTALDTRSIRDFTQEGVNHLVMIEANTHNTVVELKNAVAELKAINTNTKSTGSRI